MTPSIHWDKNHRSFAWQIIRTSQRKHLRRWWRSLSGDYLLKTPCPWLAFDAIDYLGDIIQPGWRVFEWGSGGSTLYWLSRGAEVISIEHDPLWHKRVSTLVSPGSHLDYRLVEPERSGVPGDPADPSHYCSANPNYLGFSYRTYASQIDAFPDAYFDMVVVDGRSRPACIAHGAKKVREGGVLVLDNSDRSYYLSRTQSYLVRFTAKHFDGVFPLIAYFARTTVFTKAGRSANVG